MTTAFVLSGGGSLGAVQVGMLAALAEAGVAPDLLLGTSVGAVNAAWVAGHPGVAGAEQLAEIWLSVRRQDVFPTRPLLGLLGFLGRRDHLVPPDGLRRLLGDHLGFARLEEAPVPLSVVATEITSGLEVLLRKGDALDAVAASAAIPGVFPPVRIEGRDLVDGGVANNTPISHAVEQGADVVYVLPSGFACDLDRPPRSALGISLQAITILVHQRLATDVARYESLVDLRVVPPLCPLPVSPVDFSHTEGLIDQARSLTEAWLRSAAPRHGQAELLGPHGHDRDRLPMPLGPMVLDSTV